MSSDDISDGPGDLPATLAMAAAGLQREVAAAFRTPRWSVMKSGSDQTLWRLYDGAALRYCCRLLRELEACVAADMEYAVRALARAHMEAWLVSLYIHLGGYEAVEKLAGAARHSLDGLEAEAEEFNKQLVKDKRRARCSARKVAATNEGIARWNSQNPDRPKDLIEPPHIPQLALIKLDLAAAQADFASFTPQKLPVAEMVDAVTKMAAVSCP